MCERMRARPEIAHGQPECSTRDYERTLAQRRRLGTSTTQSRMYATRPYATRSRKREQRDRAKACSAIAKARNAIANASSAKARNAIAKARNAIAKASSAIAYVSRAIANVRSAIANVCDAIQEWASATRRGRALVDASMGGCKGGRVDLCIPQVGSKGCGRCSISAKSLQCMRIHRKLLRAHVGKVLVVKGACGWSVSRVERMSIMGAAWKDVYDEGEDVAE